MAELELDEKVVALHDALKRARIAHAFGGAIALNYYAVPRATIDVDINVFVPPEGYDRVMAALSPLGVSGARDREGVDRDGQCRADWGPNAVDLFFAFHELHEAMQRRMRVVPYPPGEIPLLCAEHLIVCKVTFDRPKDWLDL